MKLAGSTKIQCAFWGRNVLRVVDRPVMRYSNWREIGSQSFRWEKIEGIVMVQRWKNEIRLDCQML